MRPVTLLFSLFIINVSAYCQTNIPLQNQLHDMFKEDQKWRKELIKIQKQQHSDYTAEIIDRNMGKADSINLQKAKNIIKQYGYPGYNLVGESGSSWFWAIVQHCYDEPEFQQQVLTLMSKEVKRHNASGEDYAYLTDRVLVNQHKKQLYGTQTRYNQQTREYKPFPIQDSVHVDKRRKPLGMSSLNDYLKGLQ